MIFLGKVEIYIYNIFESKKRNLSLSEEYTQRQAYFSLFSNDTITNNNDLNILKNKVINIIEIDLSLPQRSAIVLYYFTNMTMDDIGHVLGVNKSTVSRNIKRAKKNIQSRF